MSHFFSNEILLFSASFDFLLCSGKCDNAGNPHWNPMVWDPRYKKLYVSVWKTSPLPLYFFCSRNLLSSLKTLWEKPANYRDKMCVLTFLRKNKMHWHTEYVCICGFLYMYGLQLCALSCLSLSSPLPILKYEHWHFFLKKTHFWELNLKGKGNFF